MLLWLILTVITVFCYLIQHWDNKDDFYWPIFICTGILIVEAASHVTLMGLFFCEQITDIIFWIILGYTLCFIRQSEKDYPRKTSVSQQILRFISIRNYIKKEDNLCESKCK